MLKEFIKLYEIKPLTKKGEKYFTSNFRFGEQIAEEDIYPSIENHIEGLEDILLNKYGKLTLEKNENGYSYNSSIFSCTRLDALLLVFNNIEDKESLKRPIQDLLYGKHWDYYYS